MGVISHTRSKLNSPNQTLTMKMRWNPSRLGMNGSRVGKQTYVSARMWQIPCNISGNESEFLKIEYPAHIELLRHNYSENHKMYEQGLKMRITSLGGIAIFLRFHLDFLIIDYIFVKKEITCPKKPLTNNLLEL